MIGSYALKKHSLFKQKKNRQFNYRPRFQGEDATSEQEDFESKWREARLTSQKRGKRLMSLPVLIVMLIAMLILMYILNGYM